MRTAYCIILYITCIFHLKFVKPISVWKALLSPDIPPLRIVKTVREARESYDHAVLDFVGLVQRHSYPAEEHRVTTEDGYHLTFHRIPNSPYAKKGKRKRVAFVQHGLLCASHDWVLMGPGKDIPFLLADAGYDVWVGNYRGNTYCRSHVNMSTADQKFWEYSYHEHGIYDMPAMIDYVLEHTKKDRLYYIGHSMGTTVTYVLLSMKPEYTKKFNLIVQLSPVGFMHYGVSPTMKAIMDNAIRLKKSLDSNEIFEVGRQSVTYASLVGALCRDSSPVQPLCLRLIFLISGDDASQFNKTLLPYIFSYFPCGTSVQTIYHFYQLYKTGIFQAFDYGPTENSIRYNRATPPQYNLSSITAPIAMYYGYNDATVLPVNVMEVYKRLPNVVLFEEVSHKQFTHLDFMWATDAKTLLYDRVLELMRKF